MDDTLTAYLRRLGVDAEPPSADALSRLHRAHVERIPYETFWIHLRQGWGIDPAESTDRLAHTRRGGYCYQLNGAFGTLLTALGYASRSISPAFTTSRGRAIRRCATTPR